MRRSFLLTAVLGLSATFLMAADAQACHRNRGCQQQACAPVYCPPVYCPPAPCPPPVYCPPPAPPCPPPVYCQPVSYCAPAPAHCGSGGKHGFLRGRRGGFGRGCR
jgi:hypothetical protein